VVGVNAVNDLITGLEGTTLDARFRLDVFVARGGYGAVYRGTHLALDCPVAVKVLAVPEVYEGSARARFVEAFQREALTAAALHHPAIVRVLDVGVTAVAAQPHPFLVMEWIEGVTLDAELRTAPRRGPREALALLRPVFEAIASAHEAGVVHRDLKPANVMVSPTRRGEVTTRVLDFGLAKVLTPECAPPGEASFTGDELSAFSLSHASPEQVGRLRTGPWTDVHALALMLVEVLAGRRAYPAATSVELYAGITSPSRPTPRALGVEVGPWEAVLARALALTPSTRHRDAGALLEDLDVHLDGAQRAWERSLRPVRRPRAAWAVLAGCVVALLAVRRWPAAHAPTRPQTETRHPPRLADATPVATDAGAAPPFAPPPVTAAPPPPRPPLRGATHRPVRAAPTAPRTTADEEIEIE
jgi:serine/threonine protein kinase